MGARGRGRLTSPDDKSQIKSSINKALTSGASQSSICKAIGFCERTWQRWKVNPSNDDRRSHVNKTPSNKLSEFERKRILSICNEPRFASLPPNQIVPLLANEGVYIASESSFYRILKSENQLKHRNKSKAPRKVVKPEPLISLAPNQIYSWDITYLPTDVKGIFLYLYLIMDVYSRKIVGWQIHAQESADHAADLMIDICNRENIHPNQVTLHSDNGSPMKGATMLVTLQKLGVAASFNRPSVSNDNPYSESLFKTLKYHHTYPAKPFESISLARDWVDGFVGRYNNEHLHSSISFVTPNQRHTGEDKTILKQRNKVYMEAKNKNPNRWAGNTRNWKYINSVSLNPEKKNDINNHQKAA